jgi:nitrogen regulatory protein PII
MNDMKYNLLYVIVNKGLASRILHFSRENGVSGGTILKGRGTVNDKLLKTLSLDDIKKEIIIMVMTQSLAITIMQLMTKKFKFDKPNKGIVYSIDVQGICGSRSCQLDNAEHEGSKVGMYQSIMIIVDKGKAEDVVEIAAKAGSKGATIINGRGSGIHETSRVFAMDIEPEKEIVLIISKSSDTKDIVQCIKENFNIDKPGNGVIFIQDVSEAYGLFE